MNRSPHERSGTAEGVRRLLRAGGDLERAFVRRVPTPAEVAGRRPLALMARDVELLAAVRAHGVLTADLLELAFFAGWRSPRFRPSSSCYVRLCRLWLWGYLDRLERPAARAAGGSRPALWALGRGGLPVLARRDTETGGSFPGRLRLDRLRGRALGHDLVAAAFWAHLRVLLRGAPVRCWRWVSERDLRALGLRVRDPRTGWRLPFLPDGYAEIRYASAADTEAGLRVGPAVGGVGAPAPTAGVLDGAVQCLVVEVDMGTLPVTRFRRKARAFELAMRQGVSARALGRAEFEVLVLAKDARRLERLFAAARREVPKERWAWWSFATLEALDPARFGGCVWLTLERQRTPLLYAFGRATGP
jgi:Replication-relaxation